MSKKITYLGGAVHIAKPMSEEEAPQADVYNSKDGEQELELRKGDSAVVSDEKAAQVENDFPGAFKIENVAGGGKGGKQQKEPPKVEPEPLNEDEQAKVAELVGAGSSEEEATAQVLGERPA